ncbi:tagaturonate reductase [Neobacillus cucumis]|uniref:Altronate oxidoreductase n=1 Tax=Neobacillus cucumis TaxID=1740721 RepID=A0A2N5HP61_9BACI|nr:tagaturonate reductase [Neobacillus cucumis]PLS07315.1 altronate oxidoreductase [Neobacillus cucumis]
MQKLNRTNYKEYNTYPEKILQFGEGNFLRGFVDWQVQVLNEKTDFNGSVVVVQPRGSDKIERLNRQDGLFTLYLQGLKGGIPVNEHRIIDSISRGIDLFTNYQDYLKLAASDELRFIISNTTEAGIVFDPFDRLEDRPQKSFPGKLTAFLYQRFLAFDGDINHGCIIIPCELIENNGGVLKEVVLKYAEHWNLDSEFIHWIHQANTFCSSLVDRIVPGYPTDSVKEKTAEIGFEDELMVVGEQYHLWVIEGPESLKQELPLNGTGLNTLIVDDLTPFRTRKVKILNGAHTAMTPVAYLSGLDTVEEAVNDFEVGSFIREMISEEIVPTLEGDLEELTLYAEDVLNRFANPFIKHYLMSISLNSISKFNTRNLPALLDYVAKKDTLPKRMVFTLSSLIYFYRGKRGEESIHLQDQPETIQFFQTVWQQYEDHLIGAKDLIEKVLSEQKLWEMNLASIPGLVDALCTNLLQIEQMGVRNALNELSETSIKKN